MQNRNNHTLAHSTWNCKYHIVLAPKFRRKVFYGEKRLEIGAIPRQLLLVGLFCVFQEYTECILNCLKF